MLLVKLLILLLKVVLLLGYLSVFIYKVFILKESKCSNLRFDFLRKISKFDKLIFLEKIVFNYINLVMI